MYLDHEDHGSDGEEEEEHSNVYSSFRMLKAPVMMLSGSAMRMMKVLMMMRAMMVPRTLSQPGCSHLWVRLARWHELGVGVRYCPTRNT